MLLILYNDIHWGGARGSNVNHDIGADPIIISG